MAENNDKCPICNKKLRLENGKLRCPDCGYTLYNKEDNSFNGSYADWPNTENSGTGQTNTGSSNTRTSDTGTNNTRVPNTQRPNIQRQPIQYVKGTNVPIRPDTQYDSNGRRKDNGIPHKDNDKKYRKAALIIIVVIFAHAVAMFIFTMIDDGKKSSNPEATPKPTAKLNLSSNNNSSSVKYPEKEGFIKFVEYVFGKDYKKITANEYESITYLHIYDSDDQIDYKINDGEIKTYIPDKYIGTYTDVSCFKGLTYLNIEESITIGQNEILDDLENLTEVWLCVSPDKLYDMLERPLKLERLGIYNDFFIKSLEGVGKFTNLRSLYVEAERVEDLTGLERLKKLEELTIKDGNRIVNFNAITGLDLTSLSITSSKLKNLSFMDNMKNIKELEISGSEIDDISGLIKYKDTLEKLILNKNSKIQDFSVIGELENLTELSFGNHYDVVLPSLSALTKLRVLTLNYVDDITFLNQVPELTGLTMKMCSFYTLDAISDLKKLKYLKIDDTNTYIKSIDTVAELPELEVLDISNTNVFANVDKIFSIPSLKELYMTKSSVGIDFSNIEKNENLSVLNMSGAQLKIYLSFDKGGFADESENISFKGNTDFFKNFPNLINIYAAGLGIDSLEFVSELSNLKELDITNNYVSSLEPLKQLKNLEIVWCGDNTISSGMDLGSKVKVITSGH